MSRITFRSADDVPFVGVHAAIVDGSLQEQRGLSDASRNTQEIRSLFEGSDDEPSLVEVRCSSNKPTAPHAHEVDEIVYVLEGELHVGNRVFGPGSAIHVPARTLYAFKVGQNGVRYLNMRPRRDDSYVPKDEFMERRNTD